MQLHNVRLQLASSGLVADLYIVPNWQHCCPCLLTYDQVLWSPVQCCHHSEQCTCTSCKQDIIKSGGANGEGLQCVTTIVLHVALDEIRVSCELMLTTWSKISWPSSSLHSIRARDVHCVVIIVSNCATNSSTSSRYLRYSHNFHINANIKNSRRFCKRYLPWGQLSIRNQINDGSLVFVSVVDLQFCDCQIRFSGIGARMEVCDGTVQSWSSQASNCILPYWSFKNRLCQGQLSERYHSPLGLTWCM